MQVKLTNSSINTLTPQEKPYEVADSDIKGFLLRVQPTGRMAFYYAYRTTAGTRKRINVGVFGPAMTARQARDKALGLAVEVSKGIDVQLKKKQVKTLAAGEKEKTLAAFIHNHYATWVMTNRKGGADTLAKINTSFPGFMALPLAEISPRLIESWRTERLNAERKPSTINRCVAALRSVLSKAVEWDVIDEHPLLKLKPLRVDQSPKVRYLSDDEEVRLFKALTERDEALKAARERGNAHRVTRGYSLLPCLYKNTYADRLYPLVILALKTGVRRGELFDLWWNDVDFVNKVLTIRGETAKSNRTRHIPLSPSALGALQAWCKQVPKPEGRVFPADNGGRLDNVKKSWASLLGLANISGFRWHDMRHDFASKLAMKGVPLNTVRELCGHADLNTTLRYAHLAPDHKADAIALLG